VRSLLNATPPEWKALEEAAKKKTTPTSASR
jgi:hypothetical protein